MRLQVSPSGLLSATIIALFTIFISAWIPARRIRKISPMEAIRQNRDIRVDRKTVRTGRISGRLFGLPGILAKRHFRRNRRGYRVTVFSLFLSIVLFVTSSAFAEKLDSATRFFSVSGFDLSYRTSLPPVKATLLAEKISVAGSATGHATVIQDASSLELKKEELSQEGIDRLQKESTESREENSRPELGAGKVRMNVVLSFVDDASFRKVLEENGLNPSGFFRQKHPTALIFDELSIFDRSEGKLVKTRYLNHGAGDVTLCTWSFPEGMIDYRRKVLPNGETVYDMTVQDEKKEVPASEVETEQTVSYIRVKDRLPYFLENNYGLQVLLPMSARSSVAPGMKETSTRLLFLSKHHAKSFKAMRKYLMSEGQPTIQLRDQAEMQEQNRSVVTIVKVFSGGFVVLMSLIAVANVFHTITTNFYLRRREFAMLQSVGMGEKDFRKMLRYECLLYGSKALLYGIPVSVILVFLMDRAAGGMSNMNVGIPFSAIGAAVLPVFGIVFISMIYARRKIRKSSPMEILKQTD